MLIVKRDSTELCMQSDSPCGPGRKPYLQWVGLLFLHSTATAWAPCLPLNQSDFSPRPQGRPHSEELPEREPACPFMQMGQSPSTLPGRGTAGLCPAFSFFLTEVTILIVLALHTRVSPQRPCWAFGGLAHQTEF